MKQIEMSSILRNDVAATSLITLYCHALESESRHPIIHDPKAIETPLLQTKLYIPPTRSELVPRPRLIERLNVGIHRKLTLISAPAGFGQTTLVSDWLRQIDRPAAWLPLDKDDTDLTHFLA